MSPAAVASNLSVEDYLALEKRTASKHEFFQGEAFAIPASSQNHRIIAGNLNRHLGRLLRGKCNIGGGDLRLKIETTGLLTYSDVFVTRGELAMVEPGTTLVNPSLIAEVSTARTELYDRTVKFEHYKQIPTLSTYLLVSENAPRIEIFSRETDSVWLYWSVYGPHASLDVPSLQVTLSLADIYAGVEFSEINDVLRPLRK